MVDKERLARLVALKQTLDDTEAEINQLLGGGAFQQAPTSEKVKAVKLCGICKQPGHRADGCPNKPTVGAVADAPTELPQPQL